MPKGTPPIPGIPDEETLRKQMNRVITNSNAGANSAPPASKSSSEKSDRQTAHGSQTVIFFSISEQTKVGR